MCWLYHYRVVTIAATVVVSTCGVSVNAAVVNVASGVMVVVDS